MSLFKTAKYLDAIFIAIIIILMCYSACSKKDGEKTKASGSIYWISRPALTQQTNLQQLWEEHLTWTRNIALCKINNLPGSDQAAHRLAQNQNDLAQAFTLYFGKLCGDKLSRLMQRQQLIANDIVRTSKAHQILLLTKANKRWLSNAKAITCIINREHPQNVASFSIAMLH